MAVTAQQVVAKFAPKAKPAYVTAFTDPAGLLAAAQITTPLRLAHFMAQVMHETAALSLTIESGAYSAAALGKMWDSGNWHKYFADRAACVAMAAQCKVDKGVGLFSLVYGARMGNGAAATEDGWRYRGRGVMQTTGRGSYRKIGQSCGVDFEGDPDLVISGEHALKPALAEWSAKKLNDAADRNDITAITVGINGGKIGLVERLGWFAKIWPFVIGPVPAKNATEWKVQAALAGLGYDCGNPDGQVGTRTKNAIAAYRAFTGLAAGSQIAPDLIKSLKIS